MQKEALFYKKQKKTNCALCNTINEKYRRIFKDKYAFSIVNFEPLKNGHCMVLPIRHVEKLKDLKKEELKSIFSMLARLEKIMRPVYKKDSLIVMGRGDNCSQTHLHFHIFPTNTDIRHMVSKFEKVPVRKRATKEKLIEMNNRIKKALR